MEVLFTFLAERYERRSVLISSNLVFSQWDRIFKDVMTTAAVIDRVVHRSVSLEMAGPQLPSRSSPQEHRSKTAEQRPGVRSQKDST